METGIDTLARAACDGDRAAFASLVAEVYDRVFRLAFQLTGRRDMAEDVTQDICCALSAKLPGWRGEARFTTWLYRIVVNAVRDQFRRQQTYAKATEGWGDWETARQAEIAECAARADWLRLAMDRLTPPELRETLVLMLDGLSHAEIGAVLDVSEGTVSWRLSEARKKLRALREAEEQGV